VWSEPCAGAEAPTTDIFGLRTRTAVVVGGSSGIGLGIARRLQNRGAEVHVTGTRESAEAYDDDLRGLSYRRLDATDDLAVAALAESLPQSQVLVYSGGTVAYGRAEYDMATFRRIIDVNLGGAMNCCTAFHPALARAGGAILLIGSTSSFIATPGQPAYGASKGALVTLVKSLARAWARDGIRVNGLAPGLVATKLTSVSRDNPTTYAESLRKIPLGRWGTPQEMGDVATFLVSSMASYITGQMLLADGGLTLL
jgi:3-oxoacyl-[acyl-carrier protein] reductase